MRKREDAFIEGDFSITSMKARLRHRLQPKGIADEQPPRGSAQHGHGGSADGIVGVERGNEDIRVDVR